MSDCLGRSEEPSGSCEFYGSRLDGGFGRYCGSSGSCWSCGSCGSGKFVMPSLCNCVTQLMLYTGDKLSSSIFCCLSVRHR